MVKKMELLQVGELNSGEMKAFKVAGKEILVARAGDKYYATDNRCPHLGGKLANGTLKGTVVTCPLHGSQFDLKNGEVIKWTNWTGLISRISKAVKAPHKLNTYKLALEQDKISIEIPE
jgi:3-phenylpropionate/trans-cinnamate dioxygenase ferredoxin subunit